MDVVTRARNGLIIVIDCDEKFRYSDDYALWKKTIEGIGNQSTGSNADDMLTVLFLLGLRHSATFVLAKKTADDSGVHFDENLGEIWKLLEKQ